MRSTTAWTWFERWLRERRRGIGGHPGCRNYPTNTGPLAARAQVVRRGLACSPCYDLRSPADCKLADRSIACMWEVTPEVVLDAVRAALGAREADRTSAR